MVAEFAQMTVVGMRATCLQIDPLGIHCRPRQVLAGRWIRVVKRYEHYSPQITR